MPRTKMKVGEIKLGVPWDAANARNVLLKWGVATQAKVKKASHDAGAVKFADAGGGNFEIEWSGNVERLVLEEVIRH